MSNQVQYDIKSPTSIFNYSKRILGRTLRDILTEDGIQYYVDHAGKGGLGQMVENILFQLKTNNNPDADFTEAQMELKCTPLLKGKNDEYRIKERLVCGMIDYAEEVNKDFDHSHFYLKCRLMLLLFYLHVKDADKLDLEWIFSVLWKLPQKDLLIIKQDYETIIHKIKCGQAHLLSEGDTLYLGACRKGQKGEALVTQPYSTVLAPKRAFSLKPAYMRTILHAIVNSGQNSLSNYQITTEQLVSTRLLRVASFEEIILTRFQPFLGKQYQRIATRKGIDLSNNPKQKFAMIANAIASKGKSANVNQSEEFLKAGLTMKTIRVQANGNIKEAMSFENIDYTEVHECDNWFESRLYELFSSRFMFVIFKEQRQDKEDYILDDVFFWTMPQADLDHAEEYWSHIREVVDAHDISNGKWWLERDRKMFHVRPKGAKSTDRVASWDGELVKKYCYWFNNDYIKQIVAQHNR